MIDVHAHLTPERFKEAIRTEGNWHGLGPSSGELHRRGFNTSVPDRIAQLDEMGVDIQLITPNDGFYHYDKDLDLTTTVARECNDEIAKVVEQHPTRFIGMGTLPMQDIPAAITELERGMGELGLRGAMIND
ncbi:MAG TPA: amidohydrolase family protein, partial [Nocardioidaceae bacterium]|nr:amidohydrolase family protein [Nocardioidaceae bacterium]